MLTISSCPLSQMVVRKSLANVSTHPGNRDLEPLLFPLREAFMAPQNLGNVLVSLQLKLLPDGSFPLDNQQISVIAEEVYGYDSEAQYGERAAVKLEGTDTDAVGALLGKLNAELGRRLMTLYETDNSADVQSNFLYDVASYMGAAALWGVDKPDAIQDGNFISHPGYTMTYAKRKSRPIDEMNQLVLPPNYEQDPQTQLFAPAALGSDKNSILPIMFPQAALLGRGPVTTGPQAIVLSK